MAQQIKITQTSNADMNIGIPKKLTAIEWLVNELEKHHVKIDLKNTVAFNTAKQMEKEQIKDCWDVAHQAGRFEGKGIAEENWQTFEQYYKETYGKFFHRLLA